MTALTKFQTLPRALVFGYLQTARLPIAVLARLAGQEGNEQWPATLAFESFGGGLETVVGSVVRDTALIERGRLRQAKVARLRQATELSTLAQREREQAAAAFNDQQGQIEEQRHKTAQRAEQQKLKIEQQADAHTREVRAKAAKKSAATGRTKATQAKVIGRRERAAKDEALKEQSRALDVTKQAVDAAETVRVIQDSIEGAKVARKTR
jgi:hypothetical protein